LDDGLICGGQVNIFINPNPERYRSAFSEAIEAAERRELAGLCTVVRGEDVGRTEVLYPQMDTDGHRLAVMEALDSGKEKTVELASGEAVYVEPILPRPSLLIAGAGHVGSALAQLGALCGFEVTVVDDRPSFANRDRLPFADRVVVDDIPTYIRGARKDSGTYIVIVTRGHRNDAQCLRECVGSDAAYIGMIGSKRKIVVIYEELLREGLATKEQLLKVHSPLGLSLGDREVGEIAVSIMAELIAVRRGVEPESIRPMQYTPPFLREVGSVE
jgi:xanthine dehydrogenase accessory factor